MNPYGNRICVVSQKGGVGKTTVTANLAAAFSDLRFRTLLVELDPQGSLIRLFGLDRFDLHHGVFSVLEGRDTTDAAITREVLPNLDLLPANVWSHEEELRYMAAFRDRPDALRELLEPLRAIYDYIVIDSPPGLGEVPRAALHAADRYLVPVQAEALNLDTLPRLKLLADDVRDTGNGDLKMEGVVVTMADHRTRHAQHVIDTLTRDHAEVLLQTVIPRSIRVAEEALKGRPTVLRASRTRVGRAFQSLAEEILSRHMRDRMAAGDEADYDEPEPASEETSEEETPGIDAHWARVLAELPGDDDTPVNGNRLSSVWED